MALSQLEESRSYFDTSNQPPPSSLWLHSSPNPLVQVNNALRLPAVVTAGTVFAQWRTPSRLSQVYAECVSEPAYGNFGNSWGIYVGTDSPDSFMGDIGHYGYLVRVQYNNLTPALFRVDDRQSSQYLQVAVSNVTLVRGDTLGIRAFLRDGTNIVQVTVNGNVVLSWTDTNPLPLGRYGGLRMSRNSQSGQATTGVLSYSAGSLAETKTLTGTVAPSGILARVARKVFAGTAALSGAVSKFLARTFVGTLETDGATAVRALAVDTRRVRATVLETLGWSGFLGSGYWKTELNQSSAWKLSLEGAPVIAGSIEEIRIGVLYSLNDTKPMPETAQVQIDDSPWETCDVTQVSATRGVITTIVGPLERGSHPVHVKFVSGAETPIVYAGSLTVV